MASSIYPTVLYQRLGYGKLGFFPVLVHRNYVIKERSYVNAIILDTMKALALRDDKGAIARF